MCTIHLGSTEAVTDANGNLLHRMSFDMWGQRQQSDWRSGNPPATELNAYKTTQGYTGHEQLDAHSLIHMGGRVYDPTLGRFLSADLLIQAPYNPQSFNRYSYVFNNPLSYTDPSGYRSCPTAAGTTVSCPIEEIHVIGQRGGGSGAHTLTGAEALAYHQDQLNSAERYMSGNPGSLGGWGSMTGSVGALGSITDACSGASACIQGVVSEHAKVQAEITVGVIGGGGMLAAKFALGVKHAANSRKLGEGLRVGKGKGLQTPEKFFGNKTYKEAEKALTDKFGSPRGGGEHNKSFFNEKTKRTYNLHQDPMHRDGRPHIDIRKRDLPTDYYKDRPFFLKEGQ